MKFVNLHWKIGKCDLSIIIASPKTLTAPLFTETDSRMIFIDLRREIFFSNAYKPSETPNVTFHIYKVHSHSYNQF